MAEPLRPTWSDLQCVVGLATSQMTVVTPFYSVMGLERLESALQPTTRISIVTRMQLNDWSAGVADPVALLEMLRRFEMSNRNWSMHVLQPLHAKSYVADRQIGLVGSSNLSRGGFANNFEIMLLVEAEEAEKASVLIDDMISSTGTSVGLDDLHLWVNRFERQVQRARARIGRVKRRLRSAQSEADSLLRLPEPIIEDLISEGAAARMPTAPETHRIVTIPDRELCDRFTAWLQQNGQFAGATKLIENATDTVVGRNQGHFRRFFGSVWTFLHEEPKWQEPLIRWLAESSSEAYYDLPEDLRTSWIEHLEEFAGVQENDVYSYPLVRRYLPPRFGGTVIGGGGGVSTFKRMFPLVAKFLLTY